MFWTWLDYRPGMNFDSICQVMNDIGMDGIMLKGTTIGTTTDETGHYFLKNLPEGTFTVEVSSIGYKTERRPAWSSVYSPLQSSSSSVTS